MYLACIHMCIGPEPKAKCRPQTRACCFGTGRCRATSVSVKRIVSKIRLPMGPLEGRCRSRSVAGRHEPYSHPAEPLVSTWRPIDFKNSRSVALAIPPVTTVRAPVLRTFINPTAMRLI
eukprot:09858_6